MTEHITSGTVISCVFFWITDTNDIRWLKTEIKIHFSLRLMKQEHINSK